MQKRVVIIGAGFSGLSAASFMAKNGWLVDVLEMQNMPGGRARRFEENGFTFDMGPSWYWMPDIFERFFGKFGKKVSDYYDLRRLNPSYQVHWKSVSYPIPSDYAAIREFFESIEPGAGMQLDLFLQEAKYKYEIGINKLVHKPGLSAVEFLDKDVIKGVFKLDVFTDMQKHVAKYFRDIRLRQIMEFPVLFLGAMANDIPALYSLMNYADIKLGTWYPEGGMYKVVEAMHKVAESLGVKFHFNADVKEIQIENGIAKSVLTAKQKYMADAVIASADYHFVEQKLLGEQWRTYKKGYWDKKQMAPSCLLYYVGINKKLSKPMHHQLFFDGDFEKHAKEIYETKTWPSDPLFYVCNTTATDPTQAPENCENLFFLVPVAAGIEGDNEQIREKYFKMIWNRFEKHCGEKLTDNIILKKTYGVTNFIADYNAFKGNAYGLANTLMQTAILKPKCQSKKVKNLFFTGQLTVPGPGVPPALISGELVAGLVCKKIK